MDRRSAVCCLMAVGAGRLSALAHTGASQAFPQDSTFRSDVLLVLLDVSVKDQEGRFVPGLNRESFTVLENGRPQKIAIFDPADRPVTVGILLDESRSMLPRRLDVLDAGRILIQESNRMDELFVLHFNEAVTRGLPAGTPFSGDPQELSAALARGVPGGKTALRDCLWDGLRHLRLGRRDKKALVLISDGGDTASKVGRRDVFDLVERSAATIYAIAIFDPAEPDHDPGFLRRLAKMSGGEFYLPSSSEDLPDLCRQIAREMRARYTIGYHPPASGRRNAFMRIEVRATHPRHRRLKVRTRGGYRNG